MTDRRRNPKRRLEDFIDKAAPAFAKGVPGADAVAFLPDDLAAKWHALSAATTRYAAIRDCQSRCDRLAGGTDLGSHFSELSNPDGPDAWNGRLGGIGPST